MDNIKRENSMIRFRTKLYTKYDEVDHLKRMKDSDILAEKERSSSGLYLRNLDHTTRGAGIGAVAGGLFGALAGMRKGGSGFIGGLKKGVTGGALLGGAIGYHKAAKENEEEREANRFYNDRLRYMQLQARRRERADFKQNATQRESYSY